ncbi:aminopeptidase M1 isoform X2 [Rosa chinensis]|uniref:aminopeptidase M1 isoform X2 n=1 Tax=Rosa chinensis TaxID=74649 RepID=UPI000D086E73|nr:aminopeptidase M1 isoform X2 [Rosa chinensis]
MEQKQSIEQFKGQARLPNFAIPKRYDLHLKLDLSACTFSGTVQINVSIVEETKFLVLNALELDVHQVWFTNSHGQKYHPCDVVLDGDDEVLVLVFDKALGIGEGVLGVDFSAVLNAHLVGLYKCAYMDGEEKKNMAVTQFEAVDARRCFPCWDEPALKARFKITLDVPSELTALSNMPIINEKCDGDVKTVSFEESPIMSTYLVAVVVGLFDHIEDTTSDGVKVRAYCPVGKSDKGEFALNVAVKTLDLFSKYFSTPYSLPKLDMVAVPEFSGGAMENYGLITYRETELLFDPLHSTAARKQRMAIVVSHEVAHQWFGNLVTMEWWTDLWLNEGFATWISYMATDILFPEWKVWSQFLQYTTGGLIMDALEQSHPIQVEVHHARSVLEIFDAISYEKGSAVIRMLQAYLGDDIFQTQFLSAGLLSEGKWIVPVTISLGSYERRKNFLLETKSSEVDISDLVDTSDTNLKNKETCDEQLWVKVNIEQSGFYRVKYEDKLAARLRKAIEHNSLEATDKFGILDDAYALCEACEQSLSSLLSLMDVYRKEADYIVLSKLIDVCYNIVKVSTEAIPDSVNELKQFCINLLMFPSGKLGWEPVPGESHFSTLLRAEVLQALVTFGHDKTQNEALDRFQKLLNDRNTPLLTADTRAAAYIAMMRNAGSSHKEGFESLLNVYREAGTVQEKERILRYFASSPDPDTVVDVLNFFLSDEVRDQDIIFALPGISLECRETAWKWTKENWELILTKYGAGLLLTRFVRDVVTPFCSNEKADEVEEFFASRLHPSIAMTLKQSIEHVRIKARWVQSARQEQSLQELVKELAGKK